MKRLIANLPLALGLTLGLFIMTGTITMADNIATLRGKAALTKENSAPPMRPMKNTDEKQVRNYPEQPPVIPHTIEGYQIDRRGNKCLSCHARARTGESQAPMVSITHFMDRDGQFLASVSPRRYFCNQCHVPQRDVKPLVENDFVDIDTLLHAEAEKKKK
ncbi:MAG: nitrate reductase cytochrome c-type subunit [Methyloligellaceae bacterium]